jgi:hypothetical protein
MNELTASELDLLACFAVEPRLRDPGVDWTDNHATYEVEIDGTAVTFALAPATRELQLTLHRAGQRVLELTANSFADLQATSEDGRDSVEVQLSERGYLLIRLRPAVEVIQAYGGPD